MAFDLSAAGNVLKTRYLGPIREQLNNKTILLNKIGRRDMMISGKSFTIPLHTSRNASAGVGRGDGGTLPTAGNQGYETAVVPNAYLYGRIEITGPTIRAARDNAGAFVEAVKSEVNGLTRDFSRAFNRQLHGDGRDALGFATGAIATNADTGTFDDNQGNAFVHLPTSGTLTVDLIDTDNSTVNGDSIAVTLGAKGASSYTVTWSTDLTNAAADGDYWVLEDTLGKQVMGIAGVIDDGNPPLLSGGLHGLDVATKVFWKAQMFENSGTKRDLTLELMQEPISAIAVNSDFDESDIKFLLSNYNIRDKYVSLLVADKRFVNTMTLDGGFKAVDFNGIGLVPDPQCQRSTIWYIVPESMQILRTSDFDWAEKDGSVLRRVANKDAYEAYMFHYGNLASLARNAQAKLGDLND
jgi:hypothetical protein